MERRPALYCKDCHVIVPVDGAIPETCPQCASDDTGSRHWWKLLPAWREGDPRVPFDLTVNDTKWLRSLRIDPER